MQLALFGTVKTPLNKEISQGSSSGVCAEESCISTCSDIHCLLRHCHHDPAGVACGQGERRAEISWGCPGSHAAIIALCVIEQTVGGIWLFSFSAQFSLCVVWKFQR